MMQYCGLHHAGLRCWDRERVLPRALGVCHSEGVWRGTTCNGKGAFGLMSDAPWGTVAPLVLCTGGTVVPGDGCAASALPQGKPFHTYFMRNWTLWASNDGNSWDKLRVHTNVCLYAGLCGRGETRRGCRGVRVCEGTRGYEGMCGRVGAACRAQGCVFGGTGRRTACVVVPVQCGP